MDPLKKEAPHSGCALVKESRGRVTRREALGKLEELRREGLGYIGLRWLQVRLLPVARAAVAQRIEQRTNT